MTILACIDNSRYAGSVCDHAARAARRLATDVELLHTIDQDSRGAEIIDRSGLMTIDMIDSTIEEYVRANEEQSRLAQNHARQLLDKAAERIRALGVPNVHERLVFGGLSEILREHESGVRLIVLGRRGEGEERNPTHVGSNVERIVRASHQPVLIVAAEYRPLERFVVAYDGSPSANTIIDLLTHESLLQEADCHLLMVGSDSSEHRAQLEAAGDRLRQAGYRVNAELTAGRPEEVILAKIEHANADLLVMGAYGHSRIRTLIIGSTTTTLLRESAVPVLVIR